MPTLNVRGLDARVYAQLRIRAARRGRSMEEEARQILGMALMAPERLGDQLVSYFGRRQGADLPLPKREPHEPLDLK